MGQEGKSIPGIKLLFSLKHNRRDRFFAENQRMSKYMNGEGNWEE
jgi:hypothetical protein